MGVQPRRLLEYLGNRAGTSNADLPENLLPERLSW
jgi:hypothetical protein